MATVRARAVSADTDYPTSDGKPMAETDQHRDVMMRTIGTLQARYARNRKVYVSGNLLLYYVEGNRRKHVSPDVFVVKGIPKHRRRHYLLWKERKGPDVAFEITSASTSQEDLREKLELYRDVLKVQEYFLFDPYEEYLKPSLMGYRLRDGEYVRIAEVNGRLPSEVLGLHLERDEARAPRWAGGRSPRRCARTRRLAGDNPSAKASGIPRTGRR